jgi:Bacteriophage probable baseplate hub protein
MAVRVPYFQVTSEGVDITPWVASVSVTEDDHQSDNVTVSLPDPRMIYADAIFEGSTVVVDMGYAESDQHAVVIRGTLTKVELSYPESGVPALTLKGADKSIEMALEEKNCTFDQGTVSQAIGEIADKYGFSSTTVQVSPDTWPRIRSIRTARPTSPSSRTWRRPITASASSS